MAERLTVYPDGVLVRAERVAGQALHTRVTHSRSTGGQYPVGAGVLAGELCDAEAGDGLVAQPRLLNSVARPAPKVNRLL